MKHKLIYEEVEQVPIRTLCVVGDFNGWSKDTPCFEKNAEGQWEVEVDFPAGQSLYKLILNEEMTLNDPGANLYMPHDTGELMSVMLTDPDTGERLYNNEQYHIEVSAYSLNNYISERLETVKRSFFLDSDRKAVLGMGFRKITGIHSVTVAWYNPAGELDRFAESTLIQPQDQEEAKLWFWLPLEQDLPKGQWQVKVFMDGIFLLEDHIQIAAERVKEENMPELLPIGTVVLLKDTNKRLMIYGRGQTEQGGGSKVWDYAGCLYPEGNLGPEYTFVFDHEQIEVVEHLGLRDQEETDFTRQLHSALHPES